MTESDDNTREDRPPTPEELDEAAPDDPRGTEPPERADPDPEPDPGEDAGPRGNPAQDEEGLSHEQQDTS
jgi:hypothetical protein